MKLVSSDGAETQGIGNIALWSVRSRETGESVALLSTSQKGAVSGDLVPNRA